MAADDFNIADRNYLETSVRKSAPVYFSILFQHKSRADRGFYVYFVSKRSKFCPHSSILLYFGSKTCYEEQ